MPEDFGSLEAAADFWDTHDQSDYEDVSEPVEFQVQVDRVTMVLDPQVARKLRAEAKRRHVGVAALTNSLLRKGLTKAGK